jgi:hypothetical protein
LTQSGAKDYNNPFGYKLKVPHDWKVNSEDPRSISIEFVNTTSEEYQAENDPTPVFYINVNNGTRLMAAPFLMGNEIDKGIGENWLAQVRGLEDVELRGVTSIPIGHDIGLISTYSYVSSDEEGDEEEITESRILVTRGDTNYEIGFRMGSSEFDSNEISSDVHMMIDSFTLPPITPTLSETTGKNIEGTLDNIGGILNTLNDNQLKEIKAQQQIITALQSSPTAQRVVQQSSNDTSKCPVEKQMVPALLRVVTIASSGLSTQAVQHQICK